MHVKRADVVTLVTNQTLKLKVTLIVSHGDHFGVQKVRRGLNCVVPRNFA